MVEITAIEKILKDDGEVSDFVLITFKTDLGNTRTTRYPIQDVNDTAKLKQFVYEKAEFFDAKESFSEVSEKITISEEDLKPASPAPNEEEVFLNAAADLEKWKDYLGLGLITEAQYASKLNEVKMLIPIGYFDISLTKE